MTDLERTQEFFDADEVKKRIMLIKREKGKYEREIQIMELMIPIHRKKIKELNLRIKNERNRKV